MATTPTKTVQTALLAWQDVATANAPASSTFDCSTIWSARIGIKVGRQSGTAFTQGWPIIRIDGSTKASPGNGDWIPMFSYPVGQGSSVAKTTNNGSTLAGASTLTVTSATGLAVGNVCFFGDSSTANYEIFEILTISGTTVTPKYTLQYAHANTQTVSNQAEWVSPIISLKECVAVRAVADNTNGGVTFSCEVSLITFTSF